MAALTFHLIPHTHWDREWYLPQAVFRVRLVAMLDDLLDRLGRDAELRSFLLDGQTVLLEDYLAVRPEREPVIYALVRAGRLQLGPWYVLADEQVPSGEALIRNLLEGRGDAERLGGRSDVLYSPDAFGHPASWPDLAREFGIRYGVLWRGLGGAPGQERDLYRWRGPAGGEVILYHLPPQGYEVGSALPADPARLAPAWRRIRRSLVHRAAGPHVAVFVGADHHFAPAALGRLRELLSELESKNEVRVSRLDEFCRAAEADATLIPALRGELRASYGYAWTLQGVHSTRLPLKRRNGELELLLERVVEPLVALAGAGPPAVAPTPGGGTDPSTGPTPPDLRGPLRLAWRTLLQNQFHDSISGCTSDPVALAVEERFREVAGMAGEIGRRALHRVLGHDPDRAREDPARVRPRLVLWNPAPRAREGVVLADLGCFRRDVLVGPPGDRIPGEGLGYRPFALRWESGAVLPTQLVGRRTGRQRVDFDRHYPDQDEVDLVRVAFAAPAAPGLGFALLEPVPARAGPRGRARSPRLRGSVRVRGSSVANALVEVGVGRGGALDLVDRGSGERFPGLLRLESGGDVGDTYTYCPPPRDVLWVSRGPVRVRPLVEGPLVGVLEAVWDMETPRGAIGARLVVRLHHGSPLVHCRLELDNRAADQRLRARVPLGLAGAQLVTGRHFGAVSRVPGAVEPAPDEMEAPVTTAPAHRFAAAARGRRGLALLAPGFFEVEWTGAGDLLVTLLRSVGELSRGDLRTRPGHAGWPEPTPLAQCPGRHAVDLALVPVTRDILDGGAVAALWEDAFLPVRAIWLPEATVLAPPGDGLELEGAGLVCSAVKPAVESPGMVLRCYHAGLRRVEGRWRFARPRAQAWRVRADEREPVEVPLDEGGRSLRFRAEPGEWVTHLVR